MGRPCRAQALQPDRMVHRIAKMQNTRSTLAIVQNLVNIAASLILRLRMAHGRGRSGFRTVIAQYCGLTLSLYYCHPCTVGSAFLIHSSPSVFQKNAIRRFLQRQPRHFPAHPLPRVRHSLFHLRRFPSRGIYLSGQCLADAILHPLFLFHGRFRPLPEKPSRANVPVRRLSGPEKVIRNLFLWEAAWH